VFVETAGEDLRRRLYLTSGADGAELALRPDFTIPVCLHHLATGDAKRKASYAYVGPVFRIRANGPGEFLQAGVELLGRSDRTAADADALKMAFAIAGLFGLKKPAVRIGDSGLFAAVLDALDLDAPWRGRLARAFGDTARLKAMLKRANGGAKAKSAPSPLAGASKATVRNTVEKAFAAAGFGTAGGRSPDEIAARFVEKAALAKGIGERASRALTAFLAISGTPAAAAGALRALAQSEGLALDKAVDRFEKRNAAFASHGIDLDRLAFAADFGRRLD
jgi:ATP phosphoribosyltransferase regulatory subunit